MYKIGRNFLRLPFIQHLLANFDKERFFFHLVTNFNTFSCTYSVCCGDGNSCSAKIIGNQFVQHKKKHDVSVLRHYYINLTCLPEHESSGTRNYLLVVQYHIC